MNYSELDKLPRLLIEAELQPVAGSRFQPTGFADIGAAEYKLPDGTPMLLVESAQSVANRLEKTCLDGDGPDLDSALQGLPYVRAALTGLEEEIRTSSLVEAHRIASPYFIRNEEFVAKLAEEMSYDQKRARPLNWSKIYAALFKYDPNTLIHGVFLSLLGDGRVRVPRALTGFIEARNVERVVYGGVKNSPVDPSGKVRAAGGDDSGVYSNVPYARVEYTAEKITAYFNLDLALIRGYRLGEDATQLLAALSLLKIRRFLDAHLRLRTACDFACKGVTAPALPAFSLPPEAELLNDVQAGITKCAPAFAEPRITELNTPVKRFEKADKKSATAGGPAQ